MGGRSLALLGLCGVARVERVRVRVAGGLASTVPLECAYASIKSISNTENPIAIHFYFHAWCTVAGLMLSIPHSLGGCPLALMATHR